MCNISAGSVWKLPAPRGEADFGRGQGATTSSIEGKYGEEKQRRPRLKDASIDRAEFSDRA